MNIFETEKQLIHLDELTKKGEGNTVISQIKKILSISHLPERIHAACARLSNRNHQYLFSTQILNKFIQLHIQKQIKASNDTLNTYANALLNMGSDKEAKKFLSEAENTTDVLMTKILMNFSEWNYEQGIHLLNHYLEHPSLTEYQITVAQVNLLAANVALGNFINAESLFEQLTTSLLENKKSQILLGNCYEIFSQVFIYKDDLKQADEYLEKATELLSDHGGRYLLYVNKWKAIILATKIPLMAQNYLQPIRDLAHSQNNWETVRDCDFHLARLTHNETLLNKVIWGTPYISYRVRIEKLFNIRLKKPEQLIYSPVYLQEEPMIPYLKLNPTSQVNTNTLKILYELTKDFYRPAQMGSLFSVLYPKEYFNPFSSPQRIKNNILTLNKWLKTEHYQFHMKLKKGNLYWTGDTRQGVHLLLKKVSLEKWIIQLNEFKANHKGKSFTSSEFAQSVNMSQRTAQKIIDIAKKRKKLLMKGRGKNSRYFFFSTSLYAK